MVAMINDALDTNVDSSVLIVSSTTLATISRLTHRTSGSPRSVSRRASTPSHSNLFTATAQTVEYSESSPQRRIKAVCRGGTVTPRNRTATSRNNRRLWLRQPTARGLGLRGYRTSVMMKNAISRLKTVAFVLHSSPLAPQIRPPISASTIQICRRTIFRSDPNDC